MSDARKLFHRWLKEWGSCFAEHEEEIVRDMEAYAMERVSEVMKLDRDTIHTAVESEMKARNKALEEAAEQIRNCIEVSSKSDFERGYNGGLAQAINEINGLKHK